MMSRIRGRSVVDILRGCTLASALAWLELPVVTSVVRADDRVGHGSVW